MTPDYTLEDAARWTKAFAELEGWVCPECDNLGYIVIPQHDCGGDEYVCQYRCPIPIQEECPCSYPDYEHDLNALHRIAVKLCDSSEGERLLDDAILVLDSFPLGNLCAWAACLTAEELFPIYGRVIDKIKEKNQ